MAVPFKYNLRNLRVRWITAAMTVVGLALVTLVFVFWWALGIGMERALVGTGHPLNLIVMRTGAQSETNSMLAKKQAEDVAGLDGIERDAQGGAMVSAETIVIANVVKRDGGKANVAIRGVGPRARDLRGNISVAEGRWLKPNLGEIVVGRGIVGRFRGIHIGDEPVIRGRPWKVVGIFAADGQAYESEIWADGDDVRAQFKRDYSSLIVRCRDDATVGRLTRVLAEDKQIKLEGKRHTDYYREQNMAAMMLKALGTVIAIVLSIGAIFGAANTMFAAVASRTREIATMRVLGFSRFSIWLSFMLESALLGLAGGAAGALIGRLALNGMMTGTANWTTFSELAFQFRVTPDLMLWATVLSIVTAVAGGFLPAWRASRATIATALRGL